MLGALEVKAISRLAGQHGSEWKPLHTAVLGCLLAHRNRRTGSCFPERRLLAAHCNVTERTIDRTLDQLRAWGAIERQQPRALASQQFREAQYTFLFELPAVEKTCEYPPSRATNSGIAVRQIQAEPCDKIGVPIRKEEKDLEAKDQKGKATAPPTRKFHSDACPEYTQQDFDERDWRVLNREIALIRESTVGNGSNGEDNFSRACQRAGISVRRGYELWKKMMAEEETG